MLDRASALTLLNNFETYLKSITFIQSENNDVFKSYYVLKSILMKEPYEKTALIDFFADYRKKKESNIFKVSSTFSKPQNYNEKNITFLTETENYSLYDGIQLKNDYNFVISFQKIRSFYVDPNYSSFYHCIAFAHLEFLIKTKDLQKLQIYYKKFLKSNKSNYDFNTEKEELKMILTTSLLKIINLIDNPVYSEKTIISELVAMVNVFPSKFLDSLVILIKNLISEFINDEQTLNLHRFFLTPTEKNQLLTILELDMEYNITTLLKQICSSTLNINLIILNINPNHEPFQEIVTNNNPDIQRSNNLNLIYFGGSKHNYTIGYFPEENSFNMNKNNAMQTKKDNLNEENKKIEIICPKESISSSYTPKMNFKADSSENIFEFLSIPSERKNSFKLNYEKYVNSGQKPLSKEKEEENRKFDFLKRAPFLFDFLKTVLQKNEQNVEIVDGKEKSDYLLSYKTIGSNNLLTEKYGSEFEHEYKRKLSIEKNNENMFFKPINNFEFSKNQEKEENFYKTCERCQKEFFTAFSFDGSKKIREYCSNCL